MVGWRFTRGFHRIPVFPRFGCGEVIKSGTAADWAAKQLRGAVDLAEAKARLKVVEGQLAGAPFVEFHAFERDGRTLHLALTARLRKAARKEGVWRPYGL